MSLPVMGRVAPGLMALALSLAQATAEDSPAVTADAPASRPATTAAQRDHRRRLFPKDPAAIRGATTPFRPQRPFTSASAALRAATGTVDTATWDAIRELVGKAIDRGHPDVSDARLVIDQDAGWVVAVGDRYLHAEDLRPQSGANPDAAEGQDGEAWLENSRGLRSLAQLPAAESLPGFTPDEVERIRAAAPVLAALPELTGDDRGNSWTLLLLDGPSRDARLWAAVVAESGSDDPTPGPLVVALDAPLPDTVNQGITPRHPLPDPVAAVRSHFARWFLSQARLAMIDRDETAARRWYAGHVDFAGNQADGELPSAWAWAAEPTVDAPLADRLAAWDPFTHPELVTRDDRAGLLALLDDPRPCRWFDPRRGGAPRTLGDQALRALGQLMGIDPRLPAGIDPETPWDATQRQRSAAAIRAMERDGVGKALIHIATRTDQGVLVEAVAALAAPERTAVVAALAADHWATVTDPVLAARLVGLAATHAQAGLIAAMPEDNDHPVRPVAALWLDRNGNEEPADRLIAHLLRAEADDQACQAGLALTCARPNATRAAMVRAAILGPRLRQGLGTLIDPGAVGVAATLLDESTTGTDLALAGSMRRALAVLLLVDPREIPAGAVGSDGGQWIWEGTGIALTPEAPPVPLRARDAILATVRDQPGLFGLSVAPEATSAEALRAVLLGADHGMAGLRLLGVTWPELGEDL